jgi:2-oxoglutarate ferredoxin oxidoreductase subunit beta
MSKEIIRSTTIRPAPNTYCPGCLHSMATKLMAQSLDELGIAQRSVIVVAVGCSTMGLNIWNLDMVSAAHGRAPAVATGIKRAQPDTFVFTYQGDGDLASIGLSEIICAANRGEKFSVIFANNSTYGMTGGQLAPTSLVGQKTTTTPRGRNPETEGYPIDMCAILSQLKAPSYIARCALNSPANIMKAKASIKTAFQYQLDGKAFSFVELLTNCVTNWNVTPLDSLKYIEEKTMPVFPLGVYRDIDKGV